jgi:hypothetical protein
MNVTGLENQEWRHRVVEPDVAKYEQSAASSVSFVPPNISARLFIQYDVLFEEIKDNV